MNIDIAENFLTLHKLTACLEMLEDSYIFMITISILLMHTWIDNII